ncbi:MAG: hypothetical protein P9M06_06810 [Candidatus Saelkia tenebricola]|nr:hypothetical protein [Candidatus Saelkia tenebricola]
MHKQILLCIVIVMLSGCAGEYVYGKKTKGRLEPHARTKAEGYQLIPIEQTQEQENIEILVQHMSHQELNMLFTDKKTYGIYAGKNPYLKELIVFKVRIENKSESRIFINPDNLVILDELGTQYLYINPDHIVDLYKSKRSLYSFAKSTFSLTPVDLTPKVAGRGLNKILALLKSIELTGGYVYPGVVYDGFVAFLRPIPDARDMKLVFSNIKTTFDVNDEALESIDFTFSFNRE